MIRDTMSAVKRQDSPADTQRAAEKKDTVRRRRKQWMKEKFRQSKPAPQRPERPAVQQEAPPKDGLQFSANWKTLQEILKASQPEKKQPVAVKPPNGALKEETSQKIPKKDVSPGPTATGKLVKHRAAASKEVNSKLPAVSETKQSAAPKRKKQSGESQGEQAAKKRKPVAEATKPTEADLWFDDVDPDDIEATVGAEAADIMRRKQGVQKNKGAESSLVKEKAFEGLTRAVAIDCEMVGVGPDGEDSILARVSLVNQFGKCIYDKYVKPTEKVTDYRTAVSGIRPEDIRDGEDVQTVQREVAEILQGRIVVGHAIHNDLKILLLDHPKKRIRDTQKYKPFRKIVKSGRPSLKLLCREILNVKVQQGEHSSVQDAQATMRLYTMEKKKWEAELKASRNNRDSVKKRARKPKSSKNMGKNFMGL